MSVHARAPLRVDFAGSWSDELASCDPDGGCVVNAAVSLFVHVDFLVGGKRIRLHAEDRREHVTIPSSGQIAYDGKLDRHKATLNMLPVTGGIEILSRTDVEFGSGLGECATLDVALLAGLAYCREEQYDAEEFAELGLMVENGELGLSVFRQDLAAATLGGFSELQIKGDTIQHRRLSLTKESVRDLLDHLVLVHTGPSHFSKQAFDRVYEGYRSGDGQITSAVGTIRDLARDVGETLEVGDWRGLAFLMSENWKNQQLLDVAITTPRLKSFEDACLSAGAWGLKAMGEAGGGSMLVVCPPTRRDAIVEVAADHRATVLDLGFSENGVTVWQEDDADSDS